MDVFPTSLVNVLVPPSAEQRFTIGWFNDVLRSQRGFFRPQKTAPVDPQKDYSMLTGDPYRDFAVGKTLYGDNQNGRVLDRAYLQDQLGGSSFQKSASGQQPIDEKQLIQSRAIQPPNLTGLAKYRAEIPIGT